MNPDIAHMDFDTLIEKRVDDYIFKTESGKVVTADALRGSFKQLIAPLSDLLDSLFLKLVCISFAFHKHLS
jgi:hypothetical protein